MKWFLLSLGLLFAPSLAHAQTQRIINCATATPGVGVSQPYMDQNGGTCVTNGPVPYRGNGSLATSTSTANINTMTVNATGAALPTTLSILEVINLGSTDAAICIDGNATCTCPENTVATTNGITLPANKGGYQFTLSAVLAATPTIVACSGTPTVQFAW